jgi:hypothetical protein
VVALALGIGPNTAIFSIVYATLLAPLPFSNPDQLARVTPMAGEAQDRASPAEYLDWKKRATSFQALEAFWPGRTLNLATRDAPQLVIARQVTPGGHRMLSPGVWLGRDFRADEDQPGKQHVVLLTIGSGASVSVVIATSSVVTFAWIRSRIPSSVYLNREAGIGRPPISGFQSRSRRPRSPIVKPAS